MGALQGKDPLIRQQHRNQLGDGDLDIAEEASLGTGLGSQRTGHCWRDCGKSGNWVGSKGHSSSAGRY